MASSYSGLKVARKDCGRYTPNYLEFRLEEGDAFSSSVASSTVYVRFVSDDTVHHKGFNFSYVAGSTACKLTRIKDNYVKIILAIKFMSFAS